MTNEWIGQGSFSVRHEWGRDGVRRATDRGDMVAIVDVLRFTTTVTAAVASGYWVLPCRRPEEAPAAVQSGEVDRSGRFTLSPLGWPPEETRLWPVVALASPNGAACSLVAADGCTMLAGALVNATAVGRQLMKAVLDGVGVTVVSCGERWETPGEDGPLRFAVEDYIGAGAIIHVVTAGMKSPEALACEGAFLAVRDRLDEALLSCGSGVELVDKGRTEDVRFAARLDSIPVVPRIVNGVYLRD